MHRDLKPENVVLVEREGDPDFAKVIDFGIAKGRARQARGGPALTQAGMVFGTPDYMAPEQALGSKVDHRADLYALGVMTFEMLVGQRPFEADDVMVLLSKHMTAAPPLASTMVPPGALPQAIDAVLTKILAKAQDDRYQSALEFVQALEGALGIIQSGRRHVSTGCAGTDRGRDDAGARRPFGTVEHHRSDRSDLAAATDRDRTGSPSRGRERARI